MAILMLKTAPHAKAIAHRVVTVLHVVSAVSVLNAWKARLVQMTALKCAQRNVAKVAIHATNAAMIVAHAVTTRTKPH